MDRFAAHYIFTGQEVLRKAVLAKNREGEIVSLSAQDAMAIEYSNTIFFNGIICPQFVSYNKDEAASQYTVLNTSAPIPSEYIHPEFLLLKYNGDDLGQLFAFFSSLQIQFGYTFIDLLKVVTCNNYLAQELEAPIIKIGNAVRLVLLTKLNLVDGLFTPVTHIKPL